MANCIRKRPFRKKAIGEGSEDNKLLSTKIDHGGIVLLYKKKIPWQPSNIGMTTWGQKWFTEPGRNPVIWNHIAGLSVRSFGELLHRIRSYGNRA